MTLKVVNGKTILYIFLKVSRNCTINSAECTVGIHIFSTELNNVFHNSLAKHEIYIRRKITLF